MSSPPKLGIVLAAGAGSRMGGAKALLAFRGELLLQRAIRHAFAGGCDRVLAVLGAQHDEAAAPARRAGADVVVNARWKEGMSASLAAGITAAAEHTTVAAAQVLLVDQPFIGAAAIAAVWAAQSDPCDETILAAASYRARRGHPVLIGREHWPALLPTLAGDTGARDYLRKHQNAIELVPCDTLADPRDLDTPEDVAGWS